MNTIDLLFSWFIAETVRGSLLALAVLAVEVSFGGRMPARWRYALWLPVIFVLVSPVLPASRWSLENLSRARNMRAKPGGPRASARRPNFQRGCNWPGTGTAWSRH